MLKIVIDVKDVIDAIDVEVVESVEDFHLNFILSNFSWPTVWFRLCRLSSFREFCNENNDHRIFFRLNLLCLLIQGNYHTQA